MRPFLRFVLFLDSLLLILNRPPVLDLSVAEDATTTAVPLPATPMAEDTAATMATVALPLAMTTALATMTVVVMTTLVATIVTATTTAAEMTAVEMTGVETTAVDPARLCPGASARPFPVGTGSVSVAPFARGSARPLSGRCSRALR